MQRSRLQIQGAAKKSDIDPGAEEGDKMSLSHKYNLIPFEWGGEQTLLEHLDWSHFLLLFLVNGLTAKLARQAFLSGYLALAFNLLLLRKSEN